MMRRNWYTPLVYVAAASLGSQDLKYIGTSNYLEYPERQRAHRNRTEHCAKILRIRTSDVKFEKYLMSSSQKFGMLGKNVEKNRERSELRERAKVATRNCKF